MRPPPQRKISVAFRQRPDRMQMVRQGDDGFDVERMAPPNIAERLAQEVDVIDEKTQAALSQIGREEKAAAADKVSPIVGYRVSIAQQKVIAAARRWVSLRSTHPTGYSYDAARAVALNRSCHFRCNASSLWHANQAVAATARASRSLPTSRKA